MSTFGEKSTAAVSINGESVKVIFRGSKPIAESKGLHDVLSPSVAVADGICYERDVAVQLRDGTTIYTDVYRPEGATNVPAIVAWSPYGKRAGYAGMNFMLGVPPGTNSEMTKFEGPDPAYWCHYGYAVINPDARGAGNSEGKTYYWGTAEGRDSCDLIEWVAEQQWCNGKVGMSGDSWLAVSQWFAAAEQPPHLACIAPWEGFVDAYRSYVYTGGMLQSGFMNFIATFIGYGGRVEDIAAMAQERPFIDAYWQDKRARLERIEVPAYITAGWNLPLHLQGSIDGFRGIASTQKWLVVHREFEWSYFYSPQNLEDLRRFFDRYLKGIRNGWELTPRVRIDVMDAYDDDHRVQRGEKEFPLARTQYQPLYLDCATESLSEAVVETESAVAYDAEDGQATFDFAIGADTELTGYLKLRLWVEAQDADDLDLFVTVQKVDAEGEIIPTFFQGAPHSGATGALRVSRRELDESRSTPSEPVLAHRRDQPLETGQIVPVDIGIGPLSRVWHAGERLRVLVKGQPDLSMDSMMATAAPAGGRRGLVLHTGGRFDSHLLVPVIPKKRPLEIDPAMMADAARFVEQQTGSLPASLMDIQDDTEQQPPPVPVEAIDAQEWELDLHMPGGGQRFQLILNPGPPTTGHVNGASGVLPLQQATLDGGELSFEIEVTAPMKTKIRVQATINAGTLTGVAKPKLPLPVKFKIEGRRLR